MTTEANRPIIGIPARAMKIAGKVTSFDGVFQSYSNWIVRCGGTPIIIPSCASDCRPLNLCSGLLLPGGETLAASHMIEGTDLPDGGAVAKTRDEFEIGLFREAYAQKIPVLGICRGLQLINCVLGGTITYRDISIAVENGHAVQQDTGMYLESVLLTAENSFFEKDNPQTGKVLSQNEYVISRLGENLAPIAHSMDGVVFGFESPLRSVLAVQWHPEAETESSVFSVQIFNWLISQARKRVVI